MLEVIKELPDFVDIIDKEGVSLAFRISDEEGDIAYAGIIETSHANILHLDVVNFSHSKLKVLLSEWEMVKKLCSYSKLSNLTVTYGVDWAEPEKWKKLVNMFGFPEPMAMMCSTIFLEDEWV